MRHVAAVLVTTLAATPGAAELSIDHAGVQCVAAERFPKLEARVPAGAAVARARIHFRPESSPGWYSVEMTRKGEVLAGVLPRPKKSLASFRYYIEVTDDAFASARTPEHAPIVGANAAACSGKVQAATETTATVVLLPPGGAPPVPVGFASSGVTATAAAAGAVAAGTAAAGAAAAGGGIGATAIVLGGAAVAAGAAVAVTASRGGNETEDPGEEQPMGPPTLYDVLFLPSPPGMDVSACVGRAVTWCCQAIGVRNDGSFDDTWSLSDPNTMRVTGRVTPTTVEGTMTCLAGGPPGSFTATGTAGGYQGTWEFRGQRGTANIVRK